MAWRSRGVGWAIAAALLQVWAVPAWCQAGAGGEILVTGERRARTQAQTASSVVVVTSDEIARNPGADRVDLLLEAIPNVQVGSGGEGPTIRGQDTTGPLRDLPQFLGGSRPRATLQVDGRAISYNEFTFGAAPLWDIERVEVFRSPQTTTQGRNSIAGAIFVESADPTFDVEARGRVVAGSHATRQASAALSGPLVADQLAMRVSGDVRRGLSSSALTTPAVGIDPNRDDYELLRAKLLATPAAAPGLRLTATYVHSRSQAPQVEGIKPPYEERRDPAATYGIFRTRVDSLTLRGEQQLAPHVTLRAIGSLGDADVRRFAPPGFGETRIDGQDRSLELALDWGGEGRLSGIVGAHFVENDVGQTIDLTAARLGRGAFEDEQRGVGLFGEATWQVVPHVRVTGGARYQRDKQSRFGRLDHPIRPIRLHYDETFAAFLPKLSVSYDFTKDDRVGVLVQRAYNPGGTTISLTAFTPDTYEAETLWAFELFGRSALLDGRLHLSGNVFAYHIEDGQRSVLQALVTPGGVVTFAEIGNVPAARSRGAELQVSWRPSRSLSLDAGIGLLRTRLTRTSVPEDPLAGKEFQRSPHFSASASVAWRPIERILLSAQVRHNSGYYSDDANDPARRIAGSVTFDGRAEWTRGNLSLFGYARNLFDEFHLTYLFAPPSALATAGDPREMGVGAELRF